MPASSPEALAHLSWPELWALYAQTYGLLRKLKPYRALVSQVVQEAGITPQTTLLDAGCGDGATLWQLRETGQKPARLQLLDHSPAMLTQAAHELAQGPPPAWGRTCLTRADLNQPAATWGVVQPPDVIVSCNVLYALDDPHGWLNELASVTASDARLVFTTPVGPPDPAAVLHEHLATFCEARRGEERARILHELAPVRQVNAEILRRAPQVHFSPVAEVLAWLRGTAWHLVRYQRTYADQNILVLAVRR